MMHDRDVTDYLRDILGTIEDIEQFVQLTGYKRMLNAKAQSGYRLGGAQGQRSARPDDSCSPGAYRSAKRRRHRGPGCAASGTGSLTARRR
jgi:hypothetical protein